jgi:hypothetical protein
MAAQNIVPAAKIAMSIASMQRMDTTAPPCRKCAPGAKKETKNPKSEIKRFQEKTGDFERFKNLR